MSQKYLKFPSDLRGHTVRVIIKGMDTITGHLSHAKGYILRNSMQIKEPEEPFSSCGFCHIITSKLLNTFVSQFIHL